MLGIVLAHLHRQVHQLLGFGLDDSGHPGNLLGLAGSKLAQLARELGYDLLLLCYLAGQCVDLSVVSLNVLLVELDELTADLLLPLLEPDLAHLDCLA